ncbi:MAG: cell division protein ZapA [Candidatus Edwardsbacteria bacterium]
MALSKGIKVNIFGNEYNIKGEADLEYVQEVAKFVDLKMRQIAETTKTLSPTKIAILAALNIADELYQERISKEKTISAIEEKLRRLEEN